MAVCRKEVSAIFYTEKIGNELSINAQKIVSVGLISFEISSTVSIFNSRRSA